MANAGTALMGIGRAGGEDRAVVAAQQAIESPLLEVSIDGARGILFNVIGGNDLAMHEINTAAETITSAADPDANIIFGATINEDLEGEMIVTVVATGFDSSYFTEKLRNKKKAGFPSSDSALEDKVGDVKAIEEIDMELDDSDDEDNIVHEFGSGDANNIPNIWSIDADNEENEHDKAKMDDKSDDQSKSDDDSIVSSSLEDDLEKPSFLRRLAKRKKDSDS
jgi:cell division protein FtsZ